MHASTAAGKLLEFLRILFNPDCQTYSSGSTSPRLYRRVRQSVKICEKIRLVALSLNRIEQWPWPNASMQARRYPPHGGIRQGSPCFFAYLQLASRCRDVLFGLFC